MVTFIFTLLDVALSLRSLLVKSHWLTYVVHLTIVRRMRCTWMNMRIFYSTIFFSVRLTYLFYNILVFIEFAWRLTRGWTNVISPATSVHFANAPYSAAYTRKHLNCQLNKRTEWWKRRQKQIPMHVIQSWHTVWSKLSFPLSQKSYAAR